MILNQLSRALKDKGDFSISLEDSPYARFLDLWLERKGHDLVTVMKFHSDLVGAPFPPTLHGGTVAALLEMSCFIEIFRQLKMSMLPKTVDINVDYLRAGKAEDSFARASILRQGRRFASLQAEVWQGDPSKPIATAHLHFQITGPVTDRKQG